MQREKMEFDAVIIGAGPAGLSAAIRLKQLAQAKQQELQVCVLEKGSEVGAHILSGAVIEPRALNELLPNWQQGNAPLTTPAIQEKFLWLNKSKSWRLPTPPQMKNEGNYIVRLGHVCQWLAEQAEQLGVEIYSGFPASEIIYNDKNEIIGVMSGDFGVGLDGKPGAQYQPGMELHAKQTIFAEGCRGSLTELLINKFNLRANCCPQTYGIGIKELWEIDPSQHQAGLTAHTIGWPLANDTYGGSFLYHLADNLLAVGFVVGLDYSNPYLNPFNEFQRFKTHPAIREVFNKGRRIAYGARTLNEGGLQSIPTLVVPGGLITGCAAGFLNVPKIKGTHTAMKSGMLAAEAVMTAIDNKEKIASQYPVLLKKSWVWNELYRVRNIRPAFKKGLLTGLAYAGLDTYILRGRAPWTFKHKPDHLALKKASDCQTIDYPAPDKTISFDILSSVYLSNTHHEENQPCHLTLKDAAVAISINLTDYASPESVYCPAAVYEILSENGVSRLQINAQNCLHCKTCDIKDPTQNIVWKTPEGGGGPNYSGM